jgi:hypothetical protein
LLFIAIFIICYGHDGYKPLQHGNVGDSRAVLMDEIKLFPYHKKKQKNSGDSRAVLMDGNKAVDL